MTDRLDRHRDGVKLTRPVARNVVTRPRVLAILDDVRPLPCVLVCAPAGYGKSLAVASWLSERDLTAAAWVNVGGIENGTRSMWAGIVAALAQSVGIDDGLGEIGELAHRVPAEVPARLARWIVGRPGEVIIVLDDLNGVTGAELHDQLVEFIAAGAANLHLMAITRHDPPWPLHRMRADGMLGDVRAPVLRFDDGEAGLLFGQLDVGLSDEELAAVLGRTEGWAAGLRLAALGLRSADDPRGFVERFSGRSGYIADYLMNEVYRGLPRRWRDFLARVSTVDEVCPDLAAALGGGADSDEILAELSRLNAFIHELGDPVGWYRIHPLLLDFLRSRVTDRAQRLELHRAAAEWFGDQDEPLTALHHALLAQHWPFAAELVGVNVVTWTVRRAPAELIATLAQVPNEVMLTHPGLALGRAAAQAMSSIPSGLDELVAATHAILHRVDDRQRRRFEFVLDFIDLGAMRWAGDLTGVLAGCRAMPTDADVLAGMGVADWAALRTLVWNNAGTSELWLGRTAQARRDLRAAAEQSLGSKVVLPVLNARAHLAYLDWASGDLDAAQTRATQAVNGCAAAGIPDAAQCAVAYLTLAGVSLDRDELGDAVGWLDLAATAVAEPSSSFALVLLRACVALANGDAYDAASIMRGGRARLTDSAVPAALIEHADRLDELVGARLANAGHPIGLMVGYELAEQDSPRVLLEALLDHCVSEPSADRRLDALEQALVLAAGANFRRPFLARQSDLRALLSERVEQGTAQTAFALDLLSRMSASGVQRSGRTGLFVPLSDRELNVLRYLVSSLTTAEIADSLYISVNTVKTHQRSIYQKLSARGRREAVARARELDLI